MPLTKSELKAIVEGIIASVREELDKRDARVLAEARKSAGCFWAGTWTPNKTYGAGSLCSKNGLWLALRDTTATPGATPHSPDWKLVLKSRDFER
jgi:hypothetical protein